MQEVPAIKMLLSVFVAVILCSIVQAEDNQGLRFGVPDGNWMPYAWKDRGSLQGFVIEFTNHLSDDLGVPVDIVLNDFTDSSSFQPYHRGFLDRGIDGIFSPYKDLHANSQFYYFEHPVLVMPLSLYRRVGDSTPVALSQLGGKGTIFGLPYQVVLPLPIYTVFESAKLVHLPNGSNPGLVDALIGGDIDFFVNVSLFTSYRLKIYPQRDQIIENDLGEEYDIKIYFALSKDSPWMSRREEIAQILKNYEDNQLSALIMKKMVVKAMQTIKKRELEGGK